MTQSPPLFSLWPELQLLEQRSMPASLEAIAEVIAWLEVTGERRQWSANALFALSLCTDEALTNVVSHAKPDGGQSLQIQLLLYQSEVGIALCIADNGAAFDPTASASAALAKSLDEAEIGGHGLRLMRHYLQRFEYKWNAGWNCLLLGVDLGFSSLGTAG